MLRVIGVLILALVVLGLAGHLFYDRKSKSETGLHQPSWMHQLATIEVKDSAS